ncbi:nucleolysin TIAR-like [Galendromus occidentalis]|uniref:Nucleolysin TIAR-like n=1 Tax=Galendromus occidentalis TaxID=34638 RepID=A0AAJ6VW21_9ACAR|nr:nucleolysin TIAR-like [Galendromus occidentalis]
MSFPSPQDGGQPRTLYVGNLDSGVTEDLVCALFSQMGQIKGCKIIHEPGSDPYCFVEFVNHSDASSAITAMNARMCLGRELRVNWASSAIQQQTPHRPDTSKHHHIFVGDLSPQIETSDLREAFSPFGEISDCRVVKDATTQKSKGYGFVSFTNKQDAENAIHTMDGSWLGSRAIRTNWASRKPNHKETGSYIGGHHRALNYDEVFAQSSPSNCTVYCGGLNQMASSEDFLRQAFDEFGEIVDIRLFKDKGYAFIKFNSKESACRAIVARHNSDIGGQAVKCSWGKEQEPAQPQFPYDPYQMNYWYSGYSMDGNYMGGDYMNQMYAAAPYGQYYGQYPMAMQVPQGAHGGPMPYPPPPQQYPSQ